MPGPQPEIVLVRHAAALCNEDGVIASQSCQGLTETGEQQAEQLARRLAAEHETGHPITALYSSPVRRAMDTAWPLENLLGIPIMPRADLRVPDPGPNAEGRPWHVVRRVWPPDPGRPSRPRPAGGESWREYLDRAHTVLAHILAHHPGGRVVLVGHNETAIAVYTLLIGVRSLHGLRVDLDHTGIARWGTEPELPRVRAYIRRWTLCVHNDTSHLSLPP